MMPRYFAVCRTVKLCHIDCEDDATLLCCLQDCEDDATLLCCLQDCEDDATLLCCLQDCKDHATLTVRMMPHYFAVCRTVRTMPHWLWDDGTLLCCLQDRSWLLGPCHIDCEDDATLLCCLQDCEDHATLLCSLLLGFGLDAYVCFGTKVKGAVHAWVMTISTDGLVTFWESLSGHRSVGCGLCFCWWGWETLLFSCLKMNITYHEKKGHTTRRKGCLTSLG